jgi:hypothetical protein
VRITFNTERMTNSTELRRLRRSLEWVYYATLFTTHDQYRSRTDVWLNWAQMGFGTGVQVGPPDAEREHRVHVVTDSRGKQLSFLATLEANDAADTWLSVLRQIEDIRPSVAERGDDERATALHDDDIIAKLLARPVASATAGLPEFERHRIGDGLRTALAALSYPIVVRSTIDEIAPS